MRVMREPVGERFHRSLRGRERLMKPAHDMVGCDEYQATITAKMYTHSRKVEVAREGLKWQISLLPDGGGGVGGGGDAEHELSPMKLCTHRSCTRNDP